MALLQLEGGETALDGGESVTEAFVGALLEAGVASHEGEHSSFAEVLLRNPAMETVLQCVELKEGCSTMGPNSFTEELSAACSIAERREEGSRLVACVLTKPPESVLVVVGPGVFMVLDSHPRPNLMLPGAHALAFTSLQALCSYLRSVFPAVDMGPGAGFMAEMYNSYDMTLVTRKG